MNLQKLIAYLLLVLAVVFLYFGPYNNHNLSEQLRFLEKKSKVAQSLKDEYWALSSIKVNDHYMQNDALYEAVSQYIRNEEQDI